MSLSAFLALSSHWRRKPLQLLTLVLGIALATALWSGVQAINAEARASYARAASVLEQGGLRQIVARDGKGIPLQTYSRCDRPDGTSRLSSKDRSRSDLHGCGSLASSP